MTDKHVPQDVIALRLILDANPELYCDIAGEPRIRLPTASEQPPEELWSLRSDRVRAWIAEFIWEKSTRVLLDREIDRILNILEGKAWLDQRRDLELCDAIEHESVLEALLLFIEKEGRFEGTMTRLVQKLAMVARRAGLDIKSKKWPKGTPQFSNRIKELEPLLKKAQITVERRRDAFQRRIVLERQTRDGASSPPSHEPSVDKSHHPKDQRRNDATDPQKRANVFARITHSEER